MIKTINMMFALAAVGAMIWLPAKGLAQSPGLDEVQQLEQAYQSGQYNRFLQDLNNSYRREKSSQWVRQMMEATQQPQQQGEQQGQGPEMPKEMQEQQEQMQALGEELNESLQEICGNSSQPVCVRVRGLVEQSDDGQQEPGISEELLFSPPSRTDGIFNNLREVEQEYYIKSMLIGGSPQQQQQQEQANIDPSLVIVLEMDKLNKMRQVVERGPSSQWNDRVMATHESSQERWAHMMDSIYLSRLASGEQRPQNDLERDIAKAMKDFQEKVGEMMQSAQAQEQGPSQGYDGRDDRDNQGRYGQPRYEDGDQGYGPGYREGPREPNRGRWGPPRY